MRKEFNEDARVKFPATIQFMRLGYEYQSLTDYDEDYATKICKPRFIAALRRLNPETEITETDAEDAASEIHSLIRNKDLGKAFYKRLTGPTDGLRLIDLENPENNDFAVVNELRFNDKVNGAHKDAFRPDVTVLVNGIPLAFLEVKKPNNPNGIQAEFRRMLDERLKDETAEKFFNMLQIVAFSNNMSYDENGNVVGPDEIRAGSFYTTPNGRKTTFSFFRDENPPNVDVDAVEAHDVAAVLADNNYDPEEANTPEFRTNLDPAKPCNAFVASLFTKERFLFFLRYGITYVDEAVPQKHIMRYPQFFAAQNLLRKLEAGQKSGIIWHTQGSGKTALAASLVRILRDFYAKRQVNAQCYYVVDRLDLLTQVKNEMAKRGLAVVAVDSRDAFQNELKKALSDHYQGDADGEITVVNIQKFEENPPRAENVYDVPVRRIFIVDEAHRSYKHNGEYFKNLRTVDKDAVYVALTGTPLLSAKERSSLKFGGYIHAYFYDKSIADGYTLRIKREEIETTAKVRIKEAIEVERQRAKKTDVYDSAAYVDALCRYIRDDFRRFRYERQDQNLGAMIVCSSNKQARTITEWFQKDPDTKFEVGLVISDKDISSAENKKTQLSFRDDGSPDILVVHQMLTTGYDVPRLKKMYLLRNAKEHSLLQTISRVNRPYRGPNGRTFPFGYVVDFADVEEEIDRTIGMYVAELEQELQTGDDEGEPAAGTLDGVLIDVDAVVGEYREKLAKLREYGDPGNKETFLDAIGALDVMELNEVKRTLEALLDCRRELMLSYRDEEAKAIDKERFEKLLKETKNRILFTRLQHEPTVTLAEIIADDQIVEIVYNFVKTRTKDVNLAIAAGAVEQIVERVQTLQTTLAKTAAINPAEMVRLDEALRNLLQRANIDDVAELDAELAQIVERAQRQQDAAEQLAKRFGGEYAFVSAYYDAKTEYPQLEGADLDRVFDTTYQAFRDTPTAGVVDRGNFIALLKKQSVTPLIKSGIYKRLNVREWFDAFLGDLYQKVCEYGVRADS